MSYLQKLPPLSLTTAISGLLAIALVLFGVHYHSAKTLYHVAGVLALLGCFCLQSMHFKRWPLEFWCILAAAVMVFALAHNNDADYAARLLKDYGIHVLVLAFVMLVPATKLTGDKQLATLLSLAMATLALPALFTAFQGGWQERVSGSLDMPIIYGTNVAVLVSICIFAASQTLQARQWHLSGLYFVAIVIGIAAIIASASRGPFVAVAVVAILILATYLLKQRLTWKGWLAVSSVLICSVAAVMFSPIADRLWAAVENTVSGSTTSSIGIRLELWRSGLDAIAQHPWQGVGISGHNDYFQSQLLSNPSYMEPAAVGYMHLHNDWINAFAWFGIPLGLLFMAPLVLPLRHLRSPSPGLQASAYSALTFVLCGLSNAPSIRAGSLVFFFILLFVCRQWPSHSAK